MGQVQARPEDGAYGLIVTVKNEDITNITTFYWTIPFLQNSHLLEESERGNYFNSPEFTIPHPVLGHQPTTWKLRVYPSGEIGRDRGLSIYVDPVSANFGMVSFSVVPLQMGGRRLENLRGGFDREKHVSRDGNALGLCLGGYRQVLESIKRPNSEVTEVFYVTFEVMMLFNY